MAWVTEEEYQAAKQVRAYEYLQTYQPGRLKKIRTRNEWQLQDHDSFKINELTSKWHWKSRDIGGMSALRFLMQVDGMEYTEAVKILCEQTPVYVSRAEPTPRKKSFSMPLLNDSFYRVQRYLNQRGIRDDVMDYFDGSAAIKEKVVSAVPSVKEFDGVLYGCTTLELKEYLETEELSELCEYLTGQYSDGWGEGFEQQEIQVDGGELYVHFWQPKDYLFEQVKPEIQKNQEPEKKRPKMELLGRDGNVFVILGDAAGLLIKEGMDQQANEMYGRVMQSDNYYQALHIISEYVETKLSVSDKKSQLLECIQKNKKKSKKQPER